MLLKLARQRGELYCGGARFVVVGYGNFHQAGFRDRSSVLLCYQRGRHGASARLLAADVIAYGDRGGKIPARMAPASGIDEVLRLYASFAPIFAVSPSRLVRYAFINGLPGFIIFAGCRLDRLGPNESSKPTAPFYLLPLRRR